MKLRFLASTLVVLALVVACGGGRPSSVPSAQSRHYDGGGKGFALNLAPGWRATGTEADGVAFGSGRLQATMTVQYQAAGAGDLDATAGRVIGELTGGAAPTSTAPTTLAGAPARAFQATVTGKGGSDVVSGVVAVQGDLAWSLALAGLRSSFGQAKSDFQQMVGSFEFNGPAPTPVAGASVGQAAPDSPVLQLAHVKGPVVIYFFNVACQSCRQELPLLQSRTAESRDRVTVLAVDTSDDAASVRSFLSSLDVKVAVRYDGNGKLYQTYQVPGIPAAYFLDGRHVIRFMPKGSLDAAAISQGLSAIGVA